MTASSKTPQKLARNASKLHRMVGELLIEHTLFSGYEIRQEYRVSKVNPEFKSNREKFDWVVLGLKVVIEVMGQQHYRPVCFGGIDMVEAKSRFKKQQLRDEDKKQAALEAGWTYIVVRYDEKCLTKEELLTRILERMNENCQENGYARKQELLEISKRLRRPIQKQKAKILQREKYNWPKRKLQSRGFKNTKNGSKNSETNS